MLGFIADYGKFELLGHVAFLWVLLSILVAGAAILWGFFVRRKQMGIR
jgi:hypothetical protein